MSAALVHMDAAQAHLRAQLATEGVSLADINAYTGAINAALSTLTASTQGYSTEAKAVAAPYIDRMRTAFMSRVAAATARCDAQLARRAEDRRVEQVSVARAALDTRIRDHLDPERERISLRLNRFALRILGLDAAAQARVIGITAYARTSWPRKPGELFAE